MKKIGEYVWKLTLQCAPESDGIYSFCHDLDSYLIFKRNNGEIVWVGEEGLLGAKGYRAARQVWSVLNDRKLMKAQWQWNS
jgi:hypothetical protein